MRRVLAPLIVLSLLLLSAPVLASDAPWPMFRQNARRTGRSVAYEGPFSCELSWSYETGGTVNASPSISSDGDVYIGLYNRFRVLNSAGALRWSYWALGIPASSPALGSDGTVYSGAQDNVVYVFDSAAALAWSYTTADQVYSSPVLTGGGRVYVGSNDNNLYALLSSGELFWSYADGHDLTSSPALTTDGNVYVGFRYIGPSNLSALNSVGNLLWSYQGLEGSDSCSIRPDGGAYTGSYDNRLYALSSEGGLVWSYSTGNNITSSPALGSDSSVYIGSTDNHLYAFASNGTLLWSHIVVEPIHSSPALGSTGTLYLGSYDNVLYSINSSGGLVWSYATSADVDTSPAITADERVLVSSGTRIYCIEAAPTPTITPTPTRTPTRTPTWTPTRTPAPPTVTPIPQAEVALNGTTFGTGSRFTATFRLNRKVERPFTAYAVVELPDGSMLNCLTLDTPLVPVAENVPRLDPMTYPLMDLTVPGGIPTGNYRVMAGFFTPGQPITKPEDAFLLATSPFTIR